MVASRDRVPAEGEKGGKEEQVVEGGLFNLQGGPGREGSGGGGRGGARPWRQGSHCRHRDDGADRWVPSVRVLSFSIFQKIQKGCGNCFRPLTNFKNSRKIHRALIFYWEPVIKLAAHLKNICCVIISEFVLLYFGLHLNICFCKCI